MIARQPRFSVIVPTFNRPDALRHCLAALAGLDYPKDRFEVIVVDDGGQDPLGRNLAPSGNLLNLRVLRQANAGPGAARNRGAAEAAGEYLAFTDDDCRPDPGWLLAFAAAFLERPTALLGGCTANGLTGNVFSGASQALQAWFSDYCQANASPMRFFASNNFSLPATSFRGMGGFDTATLRFASEDRELCGRWLSEGRELAYVPQARVHHFHRMDAFGFLSQHFAYGRGAFRLRLARERRGLPNLSGDPAWMWASITRYPLREPELRRKLGYALLAFCSHAANVAGYWQERACSRTSSR